ncbi:hypothetical protein HanRHA438_Chr08g0348671 [Helianthus annuus]|nr:hypothetical protein HanIR_Chr08g0364361 [Helianthus annuus]KAJ0553398.1 hypothetical protein HanHA89_Chr08g0295951 [Helianthus annuus]KAJ0719058.1 hypothetical protein HanLR1_Chr08g0277521 [Helianthus annuus]KAJ0897710.1 hypothetical protein HanRHA438_Chr08g0348671 [Helianthus annuus]
MILSRSLLSFLVLERIAFVKPFKFISAFSCVLFFHTFLSSKTVLRIPKLSTLPLTTPAFSVFPTTLFRFSTRPVPW